MGDLSDFERGQIVAARLAGASVTKTATSLGVSRATVSEVTSTYTNQRKTKSYSGRKLTLTERDRSTLRIVSIVLQDNGTKFLHRLFETCTSPFQE
jgi:IS30 family transposase